MSKYDVDAAIKDFNNWIGVEMTDRAVTGRKEWLERVDDWEAASKPVTPAEAIRLLKDVLTLEDMAEIMAGTSPILKGFNVVQGGQ